jgi:hypothetical protein
MTAHGLFVIIFLVVSVGSILIDEVSCITYDW